MGHFFSITKTTDELSVVIPDTLVIAAGPSNFNEVKVDKVWRGFES